MARGIGASLTRKGATLLLFGALLAIAVQLAGPSRSAPAVTTARPVLPPRRATAIPAAVSTPALPEEGFVIKRILPVDGPLDHGEYVWHDKGVPAGPIVITIDLAAQTLSVFRAGYEIGTAVILYGADEKPTPLGAFAITEKDADHVSNIYGAPMPYMLRLTDDGVTIHGSDVEWGAATHGCIGVPMKFAALLFAQVGLGDRVLITNGEMLDLGDRIPAA